MFATVPTDRPLPLRQINARRAATVESSTAVRSIGVKLLPKPTQIAGAKMLKDRWRRALALCAVLASLTPGAAEARDEKQHAVRRAEMIRVIERYARSTSRSLGRCIRLLNATGWSVDSARSCANRSPRKTTSSRA